MALKELTEKVNKRFYWPGYEEDVELIKVGSGNVSNVRNVIILDSNPCTMHWD